MKKILVSIPNTGNIHKLVTYVTDKLLMDKRYNVTLIRPTHVPYENNLHHIIQDFMNGDYDFWLNIDSDNPPQKNPLDLVEENLDVVGCPTPVWHWTGKLEREIPIYFNAYKYVSEDGYTPWPNMEGLWEVDAVGTGCVLFARRVFENPEMRKKPFERKLYADGRVYKGNDISFCERAKECGFKIWAHYDYICDHMCNLPLLEVIRAFKGLGVE